MTRHKQLEHRQHGAVSVIMALSIVMLMGMTALAVDLGMLYVKRSELQKSADLGALAGASALMSYGTDLTMIRDTAIDIARKNLSSADVPAQAVQISDIVFMKDGVPNTTDPNQIEVTARRTAASGNPVNLIFGRVIGVNTANVTATARAGITTACSSQCLKPFTVPDKFTWDDFADPDKKYNGNGQLDPDSDLEMATVNVLGYDDSDLGTQITLKFGTPSDTPAPGQYQPIDLPPLNKANPIPGGDAYRENIASCDGSNNVPVEIGDELQLEPGNMVGPTKQGLADLIAQDPGAYWDTSTNSIQGSSYPDPLASPRIAIIAFYNPQDPPVSGRNTVFVHQLAAVFVEGINGKGDVTGRFIRTAAYSPGTSGGDCLLETVLLLRDSTR